jgi:uncharacterized C2H2 Zn-finger protein
MLNKDKYILPSNGMLGYPKYVTIRAMTGRELSMVYSTLNEAVINEVITNVIEPKISIDLLCDEDRAFILHSTRVLTFGRDVVQVLRCPFCGEIHSYKLDYSNFNIKYLESEEDASGIYKLDNGDEIKKRVPSTERFNEIAAYKEKYNVPAYDAFLLLQVAKVDYIKESTTGRRIKPIAEIMDYLANLPGDIFMDITEFLDTKFGLDTTFTVECEGCQNTLTGGLGITADLFRKHN